MSQPTIFEALWVLKSLRAENINEESADKKWETLSNDVKDLKSRNGKPEKEVITVRHGVNNWNKKSIQ